MSTQNFVCQNCDTNLTRADLQSHSEICNNNQSKKIFKRSNDKDTSNNQNEHKSNSDSPYYELNDGMVTFGRASNPNEGKIDNSSSQINVFKKNISFKKEKVNNELSQNMKTPTNEKDSSNNGNLNYKSNENEENEKFVER